MFLILSPMSVSVRVLSQASFELAQNILERARQLSASCVSLLEFLSAGRCAYSPDFAWLVLRPVMRLLLWLIPGCSTQAPQPQPVSSAAPRGKGHKQSQASHVPSDWQGRLPLMYVSATVTVSTLQSRQWPCAFTDALPRHCLPGSVIV
jgi:hypothetical protein